MQDNNYIVNIVIIILWIAIYINNVVARTCVSKNGKVSNYLFACLFVCLFVSASVCARFRVRDSISPLPIYVLQT